MYRLQNNAYPALFFMGNNFLPIIFAHYYETKQFLIKFASEKQKTRSSCLIKSIILKQK